MRELFPGFETRTIETIGAEIFLRVGGSGPPVLMLHGYPQTHAMYHKIGARPGAGLHGGDPRSARLRRQFLPDQRCR